VAGTSTDARREGREKERVRFERKLCDLESRIGHAFARKEWLREAVTHSSYAQENPGKTFYERLEFLGDRVLELIVCQWLYEERPSDGEGDLTMRLAWLVDEGSLAEAGRRIGLPEVVRTGPALPKGELPDSIVADVMEALVGALYEDGGLSVASHFVQGNIWDDGALGPEPLRSSPRNMLQERCDQLRTGQEVSQPRFDCQSSGPDNRKVFVCIASLEVGGKVLEGEGEGSSKKRAERAAAESLLTRIESSFPERK
jgi:ribonuclease-3